MRFQRELCSFLNGRGLRRGVIVVAGEGREAPMDAARVEARAERALAFEDGSLDFVMIDGPTEHDPVSALLAAWYRKVRVGGLLGGAGYLDGMLEGRRYGVRSAVNELARERDLVIRLTLDNVQTWFAFRPGAPGQQPGAGQGHSKPRIAVLTAFDDRQSELAAISSPNKARYCALHGYDFIEETTALAGDRSPVWAKVPLLGKYLTSYEWVFWTDADSLIMDLGRPLGRLCDPEADLVICHEDLGVGTYNVNAGQMLFRASDWSQWFLRQTWEQTWALRDPHQEQRAMIHLIWSRDLSAHVHVVAQSTFNSYPSTYREGDFLLHFPDLPHEQRLRMMRDAVASVPS